MVRVALLLLVAAGLVIFAIQNLTPTVLVVLGAKTLPFPLAVWVLGSLGAGILTTLLLTGFSSLSKAGAVRRAGQRFGESTSEAPRSPWGGVGTKRGAEASGTRSRNTAGFRAASFERDEPFNQPPTDWQQSRSQTKERSSKRQINDDWEASDIDRERWDDWGEPEPPPRRESFTSRTNTRTNIRDTADDDWSRWEDNSPPASAPSSRRSEARPESTTRFQDSDRHRNVKDTARSSEVYDAEYRVLVPPYSAQPTPPPADYTPPPPPPKPAPEPDPLDEDDDWGLDDLDLKK